MELGKGKLRRNGMNNLQNALHEQHGLIWTDGRGIYLAPVHLNSDQKLNNATSLRLGEFQDVQSAHWSCAEAGGQGACYMAAVHQSNVSVWHVSGSAPRLAFKQVRKINVQPVALGCLWNPRSDVLCLLSRQQCSFYFRHTHNRRSSFAFPSLENGKISCGCWSPDGKRLVICVGTALLIYTWTDIEANISDFVTAAWRIPGVSGNITAIVSASDSSVVCASDLPLDLLCAGNSNNSHLTFPGIGEAGPGADGTTSVKDSLLNLQLTDKSAVQDAAMLTVVQFRSGVHDPQLLASALVPALLSPDLLHFQTESQCVVVGSNTQSGLQVFALIDGQLVFASHLPLEKDERPKGLGGVPVSQATAGSPGVLVLVGRAEPVDPTFPAPNTSALYTLSLTFCPVRPEKARQLLNGLVKSTKTTSSTSVPKPDTQHHEHQAQSVSDSNDKLLSVIKGEQSRQSQQTTREERENSSAVKLSLGGGTSARRTSGSRLVEDIMNSSPGRVAAEGDASSGRQVPAPHTLETETVDFSDTAPTFHNSVLAKKYEMNWSEGAQKTTTGDAFSSKSPPGGGDGGGEARRGERMVADRLTNGHACADQAGPKFYLPGGSVDEDSVQDSPRSDRQQTTSPSLSGGGKGSGVDGVSTCSSINSSDSNYETLERQIQAQRDQINALQKRLADLSMKVEDTTCVFPSRYQPITEPESLTIQCVVGGKRVSRKFLLDNGRLQLDPVKQAFGLLTVELILDGEPLVMGANIDGYIPMRFSADSQLQVTGIPLTFSPQLRAQVHSKEAA